ncbi:MAG: M48 family metalloprotease [Caulobacteraceae bacterium]
MASSLARFFPGPRKRSLAVRLVHGMASLITAGVMLAAPVATVHAQGDQSTNILDTEINDILHEECDPVFRAAGLDPKQVTILLVTHEFNAATVNNQVFILGTDLIEKTDNPNQLIGVMAHETGHAAGYHAARRGEMQKAGMAPFLLTLGLGILAAAIGAGDAAGALLGSSSYFGALGALGYSREQEARADQAAITYLEKSGQSAKGLVDFFNEWRFEEVFSEQRRYKFFNDHPISGDRIDLLSRRAAEQPHYNAVDDPDMVSRHEIMKAKLIGFTEAPQTAFFKYRDDDHSFVARYARSIAYFRETETEKALSSIDDLLADYPNNPYIWELKGQVLFDAGRTKDAEAAHRHSVDLKPDAPLLHINLAQAIVAQQDVKRMDDAIVELRRAVSLDRDDLDGGDSFAYRLLAQAYDAKGDEGHARLATAEERYSVGDMVQARIFALRARDFLPRNTPEYRRATDIVLTSDPSNDDLQRLGQRGG